MQRAIGRAYQRFQGAHPRRPSAPGARTAEILCDILLAAVLIAANAGLGFAIWGLVGGLQLTRVGVGAALLALSAFLLLVWERVAWEPFEIRLTKLT